jgi:hypothetical protein
MFTGPNIVRDSLSLAVDVSSVRSYPGTGTKWYDLSSNQITFSANGTQTPLSTINGVQCFNFNGSGYWQSDSGHENVNLAGDCTLLFWFYAEDLTERDTFFEKAGTGTGNGGGSSYQQEIAVTLETNEAFSYYSRKTDNYDYGGTFAMTQNEWNFMGIKMSTGETSTARTGFRSKNGANWTANYTSRSNTAIVPAGAVKIGTGYAGAVENGYVGAVYCYNKMLSNDEVVQMYNVTKQRYGH